MKNNESASEVRSMGTSKAIDKNKTRTKSQAVVQAAIKWASEGTVQLASYFALLGAVILLRWRIIRRIRFRHPATWEEIAPACGVIFRPTLSQQWASGKVAFKVIWTGYATKLNDTVLTSLIWLCRVAEGGFFVVFAAGFLLA